MKRQDGKPEEKQNKKPEEKRNGKPEDKQNGKPGDKQNGKPKDKQNGKPEEKQNRKSEDKQNGKPEEKKEEMYRRTQMQKEMILRKLKEQGNRMTRQRLMLLDIILEDEYSCCKEIYYRALGRDERVSPATVYRMVNTLEEIGAISRNNMYRVACGMPQEDTAYEAEFEDGTSLRLSAQEWRRVLLAGLDQCGYLKGQKLRGVRVLPGRALLFTNGQKENACDFGRG